jgi:hypothetical protein
MAPNVHRAKRMLGTYLIHDEGGSYVILSDTAAGDL